MKSRHRAYAGDAPSRLVHRVNTLITLRCMDPPGPAPTGAPQGQTVVCFFPRLAKLVRCARAWHPVTLDDHSKVVPLLPIPNRTVKRLCADDSGRTSVKVGHRQAFISQKPPPVIGRGFLHWRALNRQSSAQVTCPPWPGSAPWPNAAQREAAPTSHHTRITHAPLRHPYRITTASLPHHTRITLASPPHHPTAPHPHSSRAALLFAPSLSTSPLLHHTN